VTIATAYQTCLLGMVEEHWQSAIRRDLYVIADHRERMESWYSTVESAQIAHTQVSASASNVASTRNPLAFHHIENAYKEFVHLRCSVVSYDLELVGIYPVFKPPSYFYCLITVTSAYLGENGQLVQYALWWNN